MRQRQTYLLHDPQAFETSQVVFRSDSVNVTSLRAAKETRLGSGSSELPQEVGRMHNSGLRMELTDLQ